MTVPTTQPDSRTLPQIDRTSVLFVIPILHPLTLFAHTATKYQMGWLAMANKLWMSAAKTTPVHEKPGTWVNVLFEA